jgi:hypothetical protein
MSVSRIIRGQLIQHDMLRIYLCPKSIKEKGLDLLKAMRALFSDRVGRALHRLI